VDSSLLYPTLDLDLKLTGRVQDSKDHSLPYTLSLVRSCTNIFKKVAFNQFEILHQDLFSFKTGSNSIVFSDSLVFAIVGQCHPIPVVVVKEMLMTIQIV